MVSINSISSYIPVYMPSFMIMEMFLATLCYTIDVALVARLATEYCCLSRSFESLTVIVQAELTRNPTNQAMRSST